MNCSVCGAMIPDGQSNCPNCGAMVQSMGQPVQPMGGYQQPVQPMGGYQQPVQPMGGYQQQNMGQPMGGYQQQNMGQPMGGYQQQNMGQPMGGYQQPNMGQPMGGYQQPNMNNSMGNGANFGGFVNSLKGDIMKIVGLVGALLILLSPFFNWFSAKIKFDGEKEKETENMFKIAGDFGIFGFFAAMLIVIGLLLILWDLADLNPAIANIKSKVAVIPYFELILIGVALLFVILALANGDLNDCINYFDDYIKSYKEYNYLLDSKVSGHSNHGLGPVIAFIGIIAAAAPRVLKLLNINVNTGRR